MTRDNGYWGLPIDVPCGGDVPEIKYLLPFKQEVIAHVSVRGCLVVKDKLCRTTEYPARIYTGKVSISNALR